MCIEKNVCYFYMLEHEERTYDLYKRKTKAHGFTKKPGTGSNPM